MDEVTASRKRKRPTYLQDFYDPSLILDEPVNKKASSADDEGEAPNNFNLSTAIQEKPTYQLGTKVSQEPEDDSCDDNDNNTTVQELVKKEEESNKCCSLCGKSFDLLSTAWNISSTIELGSQTYSAILQHLIKENQLAGLFTNSFLATGVLCGVCRDLITSLYRLQREVVKVKNSIVCLLRNNQNIERKNIVEQEKAVAIYQRILGKYNKLDENSNSEKECIFGSSQIQQWNGGKTQANGVKNRVKNNQLEKKEKEQVESLLEKRGYKYLVKWRGCTQQSWEARFALPQQIIKYYEDDISRLGTLAPEYLVQVDDDTDSEEEDSDTEEDSEEEQDLQVTKLINSSLNLPFETGTEDISLNNKPKNIEKKHIAEERNDKNKPEIPKATRTRIRTENHHHRTQVKTNSQINNQINLNNESLKTKREKVGLDMWITNSNIQTTRNMKESLCKAKEEKKNEKDNQYVMDEKKNRKKKNGIIEYKGKPASISKRGRKKKIPTEEEEFIIEALLEKRGSKFLVKWEHYSDEWNSWEPKSGLPEFITKYYEQDLSRLGLPAPSHPQEVT